MRRIRSPMSLLPVVALLVLAGCTDDDASSAAPATSPPASGSAPRLEPDRFSELWGATRRIQAGPLDGRSPEQVNTELGLDESSPARYAEETDFGQCLVDADGSYLYVTRDADGPLTLLGDGKCSHDLGDALVAIRPTETGRADVFRGADLLDDRTLALLGVGGRSVGSRTVADAVVVDQVAADRWAATGVPVSTYPQLRAALERRGVELLAGNRLEEFVPRGSAGWKLCIEHRSGAWTELTHGRQGTTTRSGATGGCP